MDTEPQGNIKRLNVLDEHHLLQGKSSPLPVSSCAVWRGDEEDTHLSSSQCPLLLFTPNKPFSPLKCTHHHVKVRETSASSIFGHHIDTRALWIKSKHRRSYKQVAGSRTSPDKLKGFNLKAKLTTLKHQLVSHLVQVAAPLLTPVLELAATVQCIVDQYKYERVGKLWLQLRDRGMSRFLLFCWSYTTNMNKT